LSRSNLKHDRNIRLACTQTSAVSEHAHNNGHYSLWDEVKFIDRDPHWYTSTVKEAIHNTGELRKTGPLTEQPTGTARIEKYQTQLLKTSQCQKSIVVYKVSRNQSTSSPDED